MDPRAQQAREHHRLAGEDRDSASQHRSQRDRLVRELWANEREKWTHATLATAVKCSPQLIQKIIDGRTGGSHGHPPERDPNAHSAEAWS